MLTLNLIFSEDAYPDLGALLDSATLRPPERCYGFDLSKAGISFHFDEPSEQVSSALDSIFAFLRREKIEASFSGGSYCIEVPLIGPSLERVTEYCP